MPRSSPFDAAALPRRSLAAAILVTLLGTAAAVVLTAQLRPLTNETAFLVPFVAVVLGATWFGGAQAGWLAVLLSFLANVYFLAEPRYSFRVQAPDLVRLLVFLGAGVFVVVLVESRNRAMRRQHEQRQWLLVAMASAGDALLVTDEEGRVLFLNQIAEEFLQWRLDEVRGRPLREFFHIVNEDSRQPVDDPVAKVLKTGSPLDLANHTLLIRRDGSELAIDDSAAPVKDVDGHIQGVILLFRDVTRRRGVERQLAERAELAEQALDPIFARDLEGRLVFWNKAAEEVYGWTREEALGRKPSELLRTEFPEPVEAVARAIREHGVWTGEVTHTCRDGRQLIEETRHVLVRDEGGEGRVILQINRDVTARLRAEAEREQALKEAREANRLKDDFLTTLSHEIRTPLNAILGWSQILLRSELDDDTRHRAVATIARNAEAQNQLISDVLDVSRIVSGKMRLAVKTVDLCGLALDALDSVRPAAEAKGVALGHEIEGPSLFVSADPDRLQQILWNLLTNAIKFTPKGGEVRLDVRRVASRVQLSVSDTGIGIRPDFLPRVFDRFSQSDSSTTRAHGGLGLGLAIVRHLAEAHGGTVTAQSGGEQRGSTFTVVLPISAVRREPEAERLEPARAALASVVADGNALQGLRVLVVDDEADARDLIREVLGRHGADVRTADSASAALGALQHDPYDLLIADIGMPGEDGYSLMRRVRRLPSDRGGSVIALAVTAYGRPDDRLRALAAGFQQHLVKPVVPGELVLVAASLFQRINGQNAPESPSVADAEGASETSPG